MSDPTSSQETDIDEIHTERRPSATGGLRSRMPPRASVGPGAPPPKPWEKLKHDLPSSLVVFLVALPLCLGIALASGAPLAAGLIAGIVGGLIVAPASGAALAVSGPAAGLTVIVLNGVRDLGSWEAFLMATVIGGVLQIVLGFVRAGIIAYYFPSTVIRGMLAGIGALLILKQLPHAVGLDTDFMGDEAFVGADHRNTFMEIWYAFSHMRPAAIAISVIGLAVLFGFDYLPDKMRPKLFPAPLAVVLLGLGLNQLFAAVMPTWALGAEDRVALPSGGPAALLDAFTMPDWSRALDRDVLLVGVTIAIVASIETLLCIEAIDKLDPYKRITPTDRELKAQGLGNLVSGALGGLPLTAVIVRGSANVQSGARTKASAFFHGVLLLIAVLALPTVLNLVPLAALAAILLHVGYKLAPISLFRKMYALGFEFFLPFAATFLGILLTDLLKGVGIGMVVAIFFLLKRNFETPYFVHRQQETDEAGVHYLRLELSEHVSFLNKAAVLKALMELPEGAVVEIDGSNSKFIYRDVLELIHDFRTTAKLRKIELRLVDIPDVESAGGH